MMCLSSNSGTPRSVTRSKNARVGAKVERVTQRLRLRSGEVHPRWVKYTHVDRCVAHTHSWTWTGATVSAEPSSRPNSEVNPTPIPTTKTRPTWRIDKHQSINSFPMLRQCKSHHRSLSSRRKSRTTARPDVSESPSRRSQRASGRTPVTRGW